MEKYSKVLRYGKRETISALEGNPDIIITEKLDGANASFRLVDGELKCFSRNQEIDEKNNLRGFYQWVNNNIDKDKLVENFIYYGEWIVPHTVQYPEEYYNNFYLFDVYDTKTETYSNFDNIALEAFYLNLRLVPVFYKGKFKSLDHIESFVGESELGGITGEGVVVKPYDYRDRFGNQIFIKFVSDAFAEKAKTKKHKISSNANELDDFVHTYLTESRVEKIIHKMIDVGAIDEHPDFTDIGTILRVSGGKVVDDILEEEMDSLIKIVKKKIGKKYPQVVKQVLTNMAE